MTQLAAVWRWMLLVTIAALPHKVPAAGGGMRFEGTGAGSAGAGVPGAGPAPAAPPPGVRLPMSGEGVPAVAQAPYQEPPPHPAMPPTQATPWLDEVRAQRRAREERRQAARELFEARRRANDPAGAAHQEAWQEDVKRRREARLHHMDERRERFRELGPGDPLLPWHEPGLPGPPVSHPRFPGGPPGPDSADPFSGEPAAPDAPGVGMIYPPPPAPASPFLPQDWNNLWYYRGF